MELTIWGFRILVDEQMFELLQKLNISLGSVCIVRHA